jgi:hypothetical protein
MVSGKRAREVTIGKSALRVLRVLVQLPRRCTERFLQSLASNFWIVCLRQPGRGSKRLSLCARGTPKPLLRKLVGGGVRQYVVLGAGLDTFAYRQPSWANPLRIFEIDHPTTQHWKRRRLAEASVSVPDNVSFVPVDFEKTSLAAALLQSGLISGAATFFSLLGVSQYLTEDALDESLRFTLSRPDGSEIVFSSFLSY